AFEPDDLEWDSDDESFDQNDDDAYDEDNVEAPWREADRDDRNASGTDARIEQSIDRVIDMVELEPELFIARDELLILAAEDSVRAIAEQAQLTTISIEYLDGLDDTLGRFVVPKDKQLSTLRADIAARFPDAAVDYNHGFALAQTGASAAAAGALYRRDSLPVMSTLRVGIIDSSVSLQHPVLAAAKIQQREFTPATKVTQSDHGTAVASLLVGQHDDFVGMAVGAELFAASVFAADPEAGVIASSDGLVNALAWLAEQRVHVVNMSLAGPPNTLVERTLKRLRQRGMLIVSAVGNDGPFAKPRFPSAYPSVIGVGAVDTAGRAYRRSGRGDHVEFTAPGVNIIAAAADGSTKSFTGTSFAAPILSGLLLQRLSVADSPESALNALREDTLDLGPPGIDPVFGRGLAGRSLLIKPLTP
ncbi:MAG: S8 family serine peptidase, partial [Halieaceae bacterium]|nr:S8 family serine peptidase [Halieaceae bacterium]